MVLKLYSLTITHKTDVGGVKLNLRDADAVRAAFNGDPEAVTEKAGGGALPGRDGSADGRSSMATKSSSAASWIRNSVR